MTKTRLNNTYRVKQDFGVEFESGEDGLLKKGQVLQVLQAEKGRCRLEKVGWLSHRSYVWRFLEEVKYQQLSFKF